MKTSEYKLKIIDLLQKQTFILNEDLAKELHLSLPSIRRILKDLENEKSIHRFHGGVYYKEEGLIVPKTITLEHHKKQIGTYAVENFVKDGQTIFLGTGETVGIFGKFLKDFHLTIITNNLYVIPFIGRYPNIRLLVLGGFFNPNLFALIGNTHLSSELLQTSSEFLKSLNINSCFFGTRSISIEKGLSQKNTDELALEKYFLSLPGENILLVDHTKFEKEYTFRWAKTEDFSHIVSDYVPNNQEKKILKAKNINFVSVK